MSEPDVLRVFVNGSGLDLPQGATVLDAVRALSADEAAAVEAGARAVADRRGLAIAHAHVVSGGMVLRLISARALRADTAQSPPA